MKLPNVSHHAHEREFHDGRVREPKPHEVRVQIPCGVHSQVPQKDALWGNETETASGGGLPQAGYAKLADADKREIRRLIEAIEAEA
jgi:hypothetical protein